ncbi:MAG: hypothetical protein IPP41_11985 [Rhodocyclaceae bacterium]|nr:hypothetical protein [Rhodocyclaceae bacterium]
MIRVNAFHAAAAVQSPLPKRRYPSPFPGCSNPGWPISLVLVCCCDTAADAGWVSLLRVVATSLVSGTFLAPDLS